MGIGYLAFDKSDVELNGLYENYKSRLQNIDFEQFKEFLNKANTDFLSQTLKISPTNSRWGTKSINQNKDGDYRYAKNSKLVF